ncbi:PHP domain-containing protein [Roseococcus sp.]|uniref:PHP domain-containing protein n=1 Tax=Roseococcus sp. TaxID=2109646 RepID=UPI003BABAF4E
MRADPAFAAPGRFFKGNVHTHSTRSDGARGPAEVCATYREAGYDFLALTDHFQAKFGFPIVDTRPWRTEGFTTILGAEVHAPATALGETWHILAVGLPLDFAPTPEAESGPQLAQRCLDAGAFVALPHPGWYALSTTDAATIPGAHAVEIYNHTSATRIDRGDGAYLIDQLLAEGRRVNLLATDDAHFHSDDAFGGWLMVKAGANEPGALLAALKAGHFYSTQGPMIEAIHWGEDSVEVHCSPASTVAVLGRGSRSMPAIAPGQTRVVLPLAPRMLEGGFGRIVVVDEAGKKAWSNAYWF